MPRLSAVGISVSAVRAHKGHQGGEDVKQRKTASTRGGSRSLIRANSLGRALRVRSDPDRNPDQYQTPDRENDSK